MRSPLQVVAVVALAGCYAAPQYRIERPGLECERAARVAHRSLDTLGYTVTRFVAPLPQRAGMVEGRRTLPDGRTVTGRVDIRCSAWGAVVQPVESELASSFEFSRAFGYSFKSLVQQPDVEVPRVASGLQVLVERVDVGEASLDLGGPAVGGGATLVRVTVRNHTDRAVRVDPRALLLRGAGLAGTGPLAGAALDGALVQGPSGRETRARLLERADVRPGMTRWGYLVYPEGTWSEAEIAIEDVETGETEGFSVPIQ